ncbi:hypothetical protein GC169_03000 [bacterium]|nr:hypothetical protein [bacterium]
MPDYIFFPLSVLVASLFVFMAIDPLSERPPSGPVSGGGRNAEDVTVRTQELYRFVVGDVGTIDIFVPEGETEQVIRFTRLAGRPYEDPRSGAHLVIAEDLEFAFERRTLEVTIEARTRGEFGATFFEANYKARNDAESGWRQFPLTADFAPYTFTWTPPPTDGVLGYDYLGIRPVAPDKRRTFEVRSIRLRALGEKSSAG